MIAHPYFACRFWLLLSLILALSTPLIPPIRPNLPLISTPASAFPRPFRGMSQEEISFPGTYEPILNLQPSQKVDCRFIHHVDFKILPDTGS